MSVVQAIGRKLLKGGVKKPAPPITKLSVKVKKPTPDQPVGKLTPVEEPNILGQLLDDFAGTTPTQQPVGKLTPVRESTRREPTTLFIGEGVPEQRFINYVRTDPEGKTTLKDVSNMFGKDNKAFADNIKPINISTEEIFKVREFDRKLVDGFTGSNSKAELDALRKSIKADGIQNPVNITLVKNNSGDVTAILGEGNHRLQIAKELGIKQIPVRFSYKIDNTAQPVGKLTPTAPKDRLLKAKDDGFDIDTVFYHATDSDITAFIPSVRGTFFTQDTGFATRFITDELNPSRNIGNNIIPVYLKKGKNFDYETADVDEIFKELKFKGRLDEGTIQQIKLGKWEEIESAPVQDILKRKGYDSYYVKEGDTKNLAVFDPKNIRSVNAKFEDPTSSNILAGGVGVAGIASDKEQPVGKLTPVDSN